MVAPLIAIFVYLVYKGASSLNLASSPRFPSRSAKRAAAWPTPSSAPPFCSAIASLIGIPIGIGGGIYLAEFGRGTRLANAIRFTADVLNGVPSIVMGIAVYSLIVVPPGTSPPFPAAWRWAS